MFALAGPVTMHATLTALDEALVAVGQGERAFSLARLEGSDSAAIAMLLALQRQAGAPLHFVDVPASVASFAGLYGLENVLPDLVASASPAAC
jgi:ABC-type transporter Mla MlaB component